MALAALEYCKVVVYVPDPSFMTFVAKIQKAKTRKDKDYFVLRTTVPKDVAEKMDAKPGDYLFFRAKKAQWYHMLNWETMENTWKMLPDEIRNHVMMDGLYSQGISLQTPMLLGATNSSAPIQPMINGQVNQAGETYGNSI